LSRTTPRSTFRYVGVLSPDLPLLRGTVRRNLTYAARNCPSVEVQRVILATDLDEVLEQLPDGIDTWVTEGGRNLSLAQRRRIALARALMGNPPILLLDEPTAGLDPDSKAAFRATLARHQGTTLLVTHDPDELALADQVWVLDAGRLERVMSGDERLHDLWTAEQERGPWPSSNVS
jgi:ABC-type multidrug transport system fused ATPase/permease subunit